jgi:glycosyltransferase involved in cell wall biosynthesis
MRILHVVASAGWRGGEIFASDLIGSMGTDGLVHGVATLHSTKQSGVRFDVPATTLGADGFQLPGLRMSPRAAGALRNLVRDWKPDVVQTHGGEGLKYTAYSNLGRKVPVVCRSVGTAPSWIRRGPRRTAWGYLMRRSTRVVAVAEVIRREAVEIFKVPESHVVTIPNGADSRRLRPQRTAEETRKLLGIRDGDRVILSVGALTWEKDPLTQIEVTARLVERGQAITHLMAGDGPMRKEVEDGVAGQSLGRHVTLLGRRRDVADLLTVADVVLFTSRPDGMEGMPATLIEAGMLACPVVAYGVAGVPEVIEDGSTGLLVRFGSFRTRTLEWPWERPHGPDVSIGSTCRPWLPNICGSTRAWWELVEPRPVPDQGSRPGGRRAAARQRGTLPGYH